MRKTIENSIIKIIGVADLVADQGQKAVKDMVKKGLIPTKEGKALVKKFNQSVTKERKRLTAIAKKEAVRVSRDIDKHLKTHKTQLKAQLKKLDKEVTKRGKQTLKKVLKSL